MQPTQTGIAVALALVVVIIIFILPGLSPFRMGSPSEAYTQSSDTITMSTDETITELEIVDTVVGTGEVAAAGDMVTVHYVGSFTDGRVFDASARHPETEAGFTFALGAGKVIQGWDQGVAGMRVGGKRHLVIPAELAYGAQGAGGVIPPNTPLIFDVELVSVQKAQ